jgi:hypothetical protein
MIRKLKVNILPNDSIYYMYRCILSCIFLLCSTITQNVDELHKNSHSISRNVISYCIEICSQLPSWNLVYWVLQTFNECTENDSLLPKNNCLSPMNVAFEMNINIKYKNLLYLKYIRLIITNTIRKSIFWCSYSHWILR